MAILKKKENKEEDLVPYSAVQFFFKEPVKKFTCPATHRKEPQQGKLSVL